jgi:AraC-like DNA-binding protein
MEMLTYNSPASLDRYVAYFWTLRCPTNGVFTLKMFANGVSGIIVQQSNGCSALRSLSGTRPCRATDLPRALVYGKRTQPGHVVAQGPFELTGAVFRPQALHALMKIDSTQINNGPVRVDDLFRRGLEDELLNAETAQQRIAVLVRCLSARANQDATDDLLVDESLQVLWRQRQNLRVPQLLQCLGISERQFERRFGRAVGIPPHQYLRIVRFEEAVRLLRERQFKKMSDLASELNYTDESHFIKEMKQFSGYTPSALSDTLRTAVHLPCALILASGPEGDAVGR